MTDGLTGIDHAIIGVRDLEAARAGYGRLGFNSTPRGRHAGWGTANYCIMFERDYLELLGIVDPTQFNNGLDRFLEYGEGLLSLALGTTDIVATRADWTAAGAEPLEPKSLGRLLESEAGPIELRFNNMMLPREHTGGLSLFACEHLTPEPMRRPAWLAHPNSARAIRSCTVVAKEPGAMAGALGRLFGSAAITRTDRVVAAHTGHGVLLIAPPEDALLMHPLLELADHPALPLPAVLTLEVSDPERTAAFLKLQGVAFARSPNGDVMVPAVEAHGVLLEFVRG